MPNTTLPSTSASYASSYAKAYENNAIGSAGEKVTNTPQLTQKISDNNNNNNF